MTSGFSEGRLHRMRASSPALQGRGGKRVPCYDLASGSGSPWFGVQTRTGWWNFDMRLVRLGRAVKSKPKRSAASWNLRTWGCSWPP